MFLSRVENHDKTNTSNFVCTAMQIVVFAYWMTKKLTNPWLHKGVSASTAFCVNLSPSVMPNTWSIPVDVLHWNLLPVGIRDALSLPVLTRWCTRAHTNYMLRWCVTDVEPPMKISCPSDAVYHLLQISCCHKVALWACFNLHLADWLFWNMWHLGQTRKCTFET